MLGGEYNWIITSELANQCVPKALFTCVVYTTTNNYYYTYFENQCWESNKVLAFICIIIILFQTNDALVAPLLRLKENNCHVVECEKVLMKNKKYNELVILYQTKGLHKKGL